jgi:hypothetical protein
MKSVPSCSDTRLSRVVEMEVQPISPSLQDLLHGSLTVCSNQWRSVALDHANSDVRLQATICCATPTLLQPHHVDCSRGLSARFERGVNPPVSNPNDSYVEDPGPLVFLVTKRDKRLSSGAKIKDLFLFSTLCLRRVSKPIATTWDLVLVLEAQYPDCRIWRGQGPFNLVSVGAAWGVIILPHSMLYRS